jgi:hypothetical protein
VRLILIVMLIAGLAGGYNWWNKRSAGETVLSAVASENGFVPVVMPDGAPRNGVLILAPPNCPSEQAQLAEALARDLTDKGIPVTKGSRMSFSLQDPSKEEREAVDRAVAVFKQGAPAVFINGMAMSNPNVSQAVAEYQRTRR